MAARKSTESRRAIEALKAEQKAELAELRLAHGIALERLKRTIAPKSPAGHTRKRTSRRKGKRR